MQKRDLAARIIGLVVFALGIGVLIFSFFVAYRLFTTPNCGIAAANLGRSALSILMRIGLLIIMVLVGSMTASRGVQMYFASDRPPTVEE